jgi:hypothetical protein
MCAGDSNASVATRSAPWVKPDRATFYVQVGDFESGEARENTGAYFCLRAQNASILNASGVAEDAAVNAEVLIGVAVVDGTFRHGANFMHTPRSNEWEHTFDDDVALGRWYKVDILISWRTQTYSIRLDNVLKVRVTSIVFVSAFLPAARAFHSRARALFWSRCLVPRLRSPQLASPPYRTRAQVYAAPFVGEGTSAVMLHNFDAMTVWFDQIYLGDDDTMGFFCPRSKGRANGRFGDATVPTNGSRIEMDRPAQTGWAKDDLGPQTQYTPIVRHASHLSRRGKTDESFIEAPNGLFSHLHEDFLSDVSQKFEDGDHAEREGGLYGGSVHLVPGAAGFKVGDVIDKATFNFAELADETTRTLTQQPEAPTKHVGKTGRYFMYFDHVNEASAIDPISGATVSHAVNPSRPELRGGIAACSTLDFVNWRYEGSQVLSHNITNSSLSHANATLLVERPVVLYNNVTRKYVMWTQVDNRNRSGGAASTSTSDWPNGPFVAERTFLPDGNETHDQTLWQAADGAAFLFRTYYADVTYWLPTPVMQPMWESVRDAEGKNSFGLGYHRAFYEEGYDDYHDIYAQRWRREDTTWNITYTDKLGCAWEELAVAGDPNSKVYERCAAAPLPFVGADATRSFSATSVSVVDTLDALASIAVNRDEGQLLVRALMTDTTPSGSGSTSPAELTVVLSTSSVRAEIVDSCCTPGVNERCCNLLQGETHNVELLQHIVGALRVESAVSGSSAPTGFVLDFSDLAKNASSVHGYTNVVDMEITVNGQGGLRTGAVASRFLDPADPKNSVWRPSSVPAVKAQSWRENYVDGNIADNPPHPALPDKLIGPERRVLTRRSKYVAVSRLTDDYMDTNGVLSTLEGEFEGEQDLVEIMRRFGGFSWDPTTAPIASTHPQSIHGSDAPFSLQTSPDWDTRFHQYYVTENDRVGDPVNFLNELTLESSSPEGLGIRGHW